MEEDAVETEERGRGIEGGVERDEDKGGRKEGRKKGEGKGLSRGGGGELGQSILL